MTGRLGNGRETAKESWTRLNEVRPKRWPMFSIARRGKRRRGMANDWETGEWQGDCKGELNPAERSEAETLANVFDCEARQAKERDGK